MTFSFHKACFTVQASRPGRLRGGPRPRAVIVGADERQNHRACFIGGDELGILAANVFRRLPHSGGKLEDDWFFGTTVHSSASRQAWRNRDLRNSQQRPMWRWLLLRVVA